MPICIAEETGEAFFLLGLQPRSGGRLEEHVVGDAQKDQCRGVWCVFWGWQDAGDEDEEWTASREASEESSGLLGETHPLAHYLRQDDSLRILPQLFVLFLGTLSLEERNATLDEFCARRWHRRGLKGCEQEMSAVKWFSLKSLKKKTSPPSVREEEGAPLEYDDDGGGQGLESNGIPIVLEGMAPGGKQAMRKFLAQWFQRAWWDMWSPESLLERLLNHDFSLQQLPVWDYLRKKRLQCCECGALLIMSERKYHLHLCNTCYDTNKKLGKK